MYAAILMLVYFQSLCSRLISAYRTQLGVIKSSSPSTSHVPSLLLSTTKIENTLRGPPLRCSPVTAGVGFQSSAMTNVDADAGGNRVSRANSIDPRIDIHTWDLTGLKTEVARNYLRTHKKCEKQTERYQKGMKIHKDVVAMGDQCQEVRESCPNIDKLREDMNKMKARLDRLAALKEALKSIKSKEDNKYESIAMQVLELGLSDQPPPREPKSPRKQKGPKKQAPRKPYNLYRSLDGIEIKVGRSSCDNDQLSCNPMYRDADDWWMHVSGAPGSHVVIKCRDDDFPTKYEETLADAALLAVQYSKSSKSGRVSVSLTRCRYVVKPQGVVAGMVRLTGAVGTVIVEIGREQKRLKRLEETKNT